MKLTTAFVAAALTASSIHALPIDTNNGHHVLARSDLELDGSTALQAARRGTDTDFVSRGLVHHPEPKNEAIILPDALQKRGKLPTILRDLYPEARNAELAHFVETKDLRRQIKEARQLKEAILEVGRSEDQEMLAVTRDIERALKLKLGDLKNSKRQQAKPRTFSIPKKESSTVRKPFDATRHRTASHIPSLKSYEVAPRVKGSPTFMQRVANWLEKQLEKKLN